MSQSTIGKVCPLEGQTQEEIWKPVVGFEGLYEVSSLGRIKSLHRGREKIRKLCVHTDGYIVLTISKKGKPRACKVHRLMGYAFLDLADDLQIDHINGIKGDNRLENLRVVTRQQNARSYRTFSGSSKYRGVAASDCRKNPWRAQIGLDGKVVSLGAFKTEKEGAEAYNAKAIELGFNPEALNKL